MLITAECQVELIYFVCFSSNRLQIMNTIHINIMFVSVLNVDNAYSETSQLLAISYAFSKKMFD